MTITHTYRTNANPFLSRYTLKKAGVASRNIAVILKAQICVVLVLASMMFFTTYAVDVTTGVIERTPTGLSSAVHA